MESLAKQFNHDFDKGDFELFDKNINQIYFENPNGFWVKRNYNKLGNEIYYENSYDYWIKREYNKSGNILYSKSSTGFWVKIEYDENNIMIYYESSKSIIFDNRPKEIITINGKKYQEI